MIFLFLLPLWLNAATSDLKADHFHFDGKVAHLEGNIALNHTIGKISSDFADIILDPAKTKGPFSKLFLRGQVFIQRNITQLRCTEAFIDCIKEEGKFSSSSKVELYQTVNQKELSIKSKEAVVKYEKDHILEAVAKGLVEVSWDQTLARGPELFLKRMEGNDYEVVLKPDAYLVLGNEHELHGDSIKATTKNESAIVENPKGSLKKGELDVEADELLWQNETLTLTGNVKIRLESKGTLTTEGPVMIHRDKNKEWDSAEIENESTFIRADGEKSFTLIASKGVKADLKNRRIVFESIPGKPVHMLDDLGEAFGDKLTLVYLNKELDKVILEGDVYLSHVLNSEVERSYAKGDRLIYEPKTYETILESDHGRVFIFDRVNQLEVSAPRIRMKRDPVTRKETVRGEGDVRFHLLDKEFKELKDRFKFEGEK